MEKEERDGIYCETPLQTAVYNSNLQMARMLIEGCKSDTMKTLRKPYRKYRLDRNRCALHVEVKFKLDMTLKMFVSSWGC